MITSICIGLFGYEIQNWVLIITVIQDIALTSLLFRIGAK